MSRWQGFVKEETEDFLTLSGTEEGIGRLASCGASEGDLCVFCSRQIFS